MDMPKNWFNFDNYVQAFVASNMAVAFRNSIIVVVVVLVVTTIIGTMLAYVLSRFQFPGNGLIRGMFALAALLPGIAMQVALYKMMVNFHAVNTMWGYIVMMCGTDVISIYVFIQFFENISTSLDEAAIMDGASYFTVYYKILLPLLKPAIVTCAILKGVGVYNEYYAANPHRRGKDLLLRKHLRRKRGEIRRMDTKGYCSRPVLRRQHQGATASIQHPLDWGAHLWRCGHHGRQAHLYPWIVCVGGITYGQPEHRREGGASVYRQRRESSH